MSTENDNKDESKSVDLPPYGARNADPITDAPMSHPIETGIGAAMGGAATGAVVGMAIGPPGVILGTVLGAVVGGFAGKGVGELIDPTTEDNWVREWQAGRRHEEELNEEKAAEAYRFGLKSEFEHPHEAFDDVEPQLRAKWEAQRGADDPHWEDIHNPARDGYERMRTFRDRG